MRLIVAPKKKIAKQAREFVQQVQKTPSAIPKATIIDLVETMLVYKFPQLSRQEVATMLGLADSVRQTRVFHEGAEAMVLRLLNRRFGKLSPALKSQIEVLTIDQLEQLGDALLDFTEIADLVGWLQTHTANE